MNALFAAATAINAGFKVIAVEAGTTIVEFAEADAKAMNDYYNDKADLTPELAAKMTLLADAYTSAFNRRAFIEVQCDNATTARGLFERVVPAFATAKLAYPAPEFSNAVKFSVPSLNLPALNIPQMAEHLQETLETCEIVAKLKQAMAAGATKH